MSLSTRALLNETGAELTKSFRAPEFVLPTLLMPTTFYLLFGVMLSQSGGAAAYLLATYGVFAVMGPSLFGFGAGVASERERGWLSLKRTAPVPGYLHVAARLAATVLFGALALLPLYAAAGFAGDVALARSDWAVLLACHVLAVVPFSLLGLAIGFTFGANAAVAVANLAFLGLAVLGGLWFPASMFPDGLRAVGQALPSYHLAEVALAVVRPEPDRNVLVHLAIILATTGLLGALAAWRWSRQA
ncbi:MAG: ABC transporter permease [Pseudomonadota bacterium]